MTIIRIEDIDSNRIQAVVFDFDGTLYDKRHLAFWLVMANLPYILMLHEERRVRALMKGQWLGSKEDFYTMLFNQIAKRRKSTAKQVKKWYFSRFLPSYAQVLKRYYQPAPWANELFRQLHEKGILVAVFSDYGWTEQRLEALGINTAMVDHVFSAPDMGGLKPCPQVFQQVARIIDVPAKQILMVGDRTDTDGAGAKSTGMIFFNTNENGPAAATLTAGRL